MPARNSASLTRPSAHHPTVVRTHSSRWPPAAPPPAWTGCTSITPFSIRYFMASMNEPSSIRPSAHHPAVVRTQPGTPGPAVSLKKTTGMEAVARSLPSML